VCGGLVSISFHLQDLLSSSARRAPVLRELDLSQNNIASVERASLFYLEQLEVIDLSNNMLDETNFWMVRSQNQRTFPKHIFLPVSWSLPPTSKSPFAPNTSVMIASSHCGRSQNFVLTLLTLFGLTTTTAWLVNPRL
jgi:hypothetical protein